MLVCGQLPPPPPPEEIVPPVKVMVSFGVGGDFSRGTIVLEPLMLIHLQFFCVVFSSHVMILILICSLSSN